MNNKLMVIIVIMGMIIMINEIKTTIGAFNSPYLENGTMHITSGCEDYKMNLQNTKNNDIMFQIVVFSEKNITFPNLITEVVPSNSNLKVSFTVCVDTLIDYETVQINYTVIENSIGEGMITLGTGINKKFLVVKLPVIVLEVNETNKTEEIVQPINNNGGSGSSSGSNKPKPQSNSGSGGGIITRKQQNITNETIIKINNTINTTEEIIPIIEDDVNETQIVIENETIEKPILHVRVRSSLFNKILLGCSILFLIILIYFIFKPIKKSEVKQ